MSLTGNQVEQLHEALLSAFPKIIPLKMLVETKLEANLDRIAGGTDLSAIIFELIQWARAHGRCEELVEKALIANPRNPELRRFAEEFLSPPTKPNQVSPQAEQQQATQEKTATSNARKVTWLQISDLHLQQDIPYEQNPMLGSLLTSLPGLIKKQGHPFDLIFVVGDIAHSGKSEEYKQASIFFDQLLKITGLRKDHLFVIPGNHDIDRDARKYLLRTLASETDSREYFNNDDQPHFDRLKAFHAWYDAYFAEVTRGHAPHSTCYPPEVIEVKGVRIGILALNSALFCYDDADQKKLWIGSTCLQTAARQLKDKTPTVCVALMHHPLDWLSEIDRGKIEKILSDNVICLLRGHLHTTNARSAISNQEHLFSLAAGATYQNQTSSNTAIITRFDYDAQEMDVLSIRYEDDSNKWILDPTVSYYHAYSEGNNITTWESIDPDMNRSMPRSPNEVQNTLKSVVVASQNQPARKKLISRNTLIAISLCAVIIGGVVYQFRSHIAAMLGFGVRLKVLTTPSKKKMFADLAEAFCRDHPYCKFEIDADDSRAGAQQILKTKNSKNYDIFNPSSKDVNDSLADSWTNLYHTTLITTNDDVVFGGTPFVFLTTKEIVDEKKLDLFLAKENPWEVIRNNPSKYSFSFGNPDNSVYGVACLSMIEQDRQACHPEMSLVSYLRDVMVGSAYYDSFSEISHTAMHNEFIRKLRDNGEPPCDFIVTDEQDAWVSILDLKNKELNLRVIYPYRTVYAEFKVSLLVGEWSDKAKQQTAKEFFAFLKEDKTARSIALQDKFHMGQNLKHDIPTKDAEFQGACLNELQNYAKVLNYDKTLMSITKLWTDNIKDLIKK